MLFAEYPDVFLKTVSYTTRSPRPGETPGVTYYYITQEEFDKMVKEDKFVENCHVHGHSYGTAKSEIERITKTNKVIRDILLLLDLLVRN